MTVLPELVKTLTNDVGIATGVTGAELGEGRVELSGRIGSVGGVILGSCEERFGTCIELRVRVEGGEESGAGGRDASRDRGGVGGGSGGGGGGLGSNRCYRRTEDEKGRDQRAGGGGESEGLHCGGGVLVNAKTVSRWYEWNRNER